MKEKDFIRRENEAMIDKSAKRQISNIDRLLLVGAGKMGIAMLKGWIKMGLNPNGVYVQDPNVMGESKEFCDQHQIAYGDAAPAILDPEVVILAVKPQMMGDVLKQIKGFATQSNLFISVAAGLKLEFYEDILSKKSNVIRIMPNTPAAISDGMSVMVGNQNVKSAHIEMATALAQTIGLVEYIEDEDLMDAVTALSGSGPAYVFLMAEMMTKAGIKAGLTPRLAETLAIQTIKGSGNLMAATGEDPKILRQNVTSPNGTTQAGLEALNLDGAFETLLDNTIQAAKKRSIELAEQN